MTQPYLQHYGVLGMKWGIRHDRKSDGTTKATKKRVNYVTKKSYANNAIATVTRTGRSLAVASVASMAIPGSLFGFLGAAAFASALYGPVKSLIRSENGKDTTVKVLKSIGDKTCKPPKNLSKIRKISEPESIEDSVASVNKYNRFKSGSKNNCVNASVAIDMRRRGYDVSARYNKDGVMTSLVMPSIYKGAVVTDVPTKSKTAQGKKTEFFNALESQGDGARGIAIINNSNGTHAMYYENVKGETRIYDGQKSNRTAAIWSQNYISTSSKSQKCSYIRLDTCTPTDNVSYLVTDGRQDEAF